MERYLLHQIYNCKNKTTVREESLAMGKLRYELFYEECKEDNSLVCYGAEIECSLFGETEKEILRDITADKDLAYEFFERLVAYFVTPVTLRCVAEDFIEEKYGGM